MKDTTPLNEVEKELKLYSIMEVSQILKVARRTIYHWIKHNRIKCYKIGRTWAFKPADIEEFILSQKTPGSK